MKLTNIKNSKKIKKNIVKLIEKWIRDLKGYLIKEYPNDQHDYSSRKWKLKL